MKSIMMNELTIKLEMTKDVWNVCFDIWPFGLKCLFVFAICVYDRDTFFFLSFLFLILG